jgi:hypothetical protein
MGQQRTDTTLDSLRLTSVIRLPMFPLETSQTMAYPAVQVPQDRWRLAEAEIADPSSQRRRESGNDHCEASALGPFGEGFHPRLAPHQGLGSNFPPFRAFPTGETEAKEAPVSRVIHRTLCAVHAELQALRNKATDTRHNACTSSGAAHVDVAIIGVATEAEPSRFEFLVEFI